MLLGGLGMLAGCLSPQQHGAEKQDENQEVIQRLQGIWLDDNTEAPLFKIQGDSIYYASQIWGIERSGFFNGREKWAKDFENQRV